MPTQSTCSYCGMTGFRTWAEYNNHVRDVVNCRRSRPRLAPEEKARIVAKVEAGLAPHIISVTNHCEFCGPTDSGGYTRFDGKFLCESCLKKSVNEAIEEVASKI